MQPEGVDSRKLDRGAKEKCRRLQMKNLYAQLASLLPSSTSKDKLPLPALLEQSFGYVKHLKERLEQLKKRKEKLKGIVQPAVEVYEKGSSLEVSLLTGPLNKSFMLSQVLSILEEEGAEVVSANCSTMSDRIYYTIRSEAFSSRIGIESSRVLQRLKRLSGAGVAPSAMT